MPIVFVFHEEVLLSVLSLLNAAMPVTIRQPQGTIGATCMASTHFVRSVQSFSPIMPW